MELWLDTIDFNFVEHALTRLNVTGITTNPSILSHGKQAIATIIQSLLDLQPGRVAVQVTADDEHQMLMQAQRLYSLNERIIIKVPVNQQGLYVIKQLAMKNIPTMATAVFETSQVYLSMLAGAEYVAPYLGKMEKATTTAWAVLADMLHTIKLHNHSLKILAASISSKQQITQCLLHGVHAITLPATAYQALMQEHAQSMQCVSKFQEDWHARSLIHTTDIL